MPPKVEHDRGRFIIELRQRKLEGDSLDLAKRTVTHLLKVVATSKYVDIKGLLDALRAEGALIIANCRNQFVVINIVLRVLKLVREEAVRLYTGKDEVVTDPFDSLHSLWGSTDHSPKAVDRSEIREAMIGTLSELRDELELSVENIESVAVEHIHERDTVVTYGYGDTVLSFLTSAARKHRFRVIVSRCSPENKGETMVAKLKAASSKTAGEKEKHAVRFAGVEVIDDAAMSAVMPQANKVILGAHSVLADGGFIGSAGTYALCLAAKRHAVPVIVCAAFYKLTPKFLSADDQELFNEIRSPLDLLPATSSPAVLENVSVYHSSYDYIPPELVSLYIMQASANTPSYVYRLVGEYYHPDDVAALIH